MDSSVQDRESSSIGANHHGSSLCLCGDSGRSPSRPQASADAEDAGVGRCMVEGDGGCSGGRRDAKKAQRGVPHAI